MTLNSIIFHTGRLNEIRDFYEGLLELSTGTYVKNNETVPDYSDSYVNYHLGGALLCFERDMNRTDIGTVVIDVDNFQDFQSRVKEKGIKIEEGNDHFFRIRDPEGRALIIEPKR